MNHNSRAKRHVEADFSDFREDNDDFRDEGFEDETLG
jgi:hypothetical protein